MSSLKMSFLKTKSKTCSLDISLMVLGNCSDEGLVVPRYNAPRLPNVTAKVAAKKDDSGQFAPVLNITWNQLPDGKTDMITYRTIIYLKITKSFQSNCLFDRKSSSSNRTCTDGQHNYLFKALFFFELNYFPQVVYSP